MDVPYLLTGERMYYRNRNGTKNEQRPSVEDLTNEAKEWLWFPDNLDSKSLISPYDTSLVLFEPDYKNPAQIKLANALCRYIELKNN